MDNAHPYFSGTGIYSQYFSVGTLMKNRRFILSTNDVKNIMEVWLNGQKVGVRCWQPFELDITDQLKQGENRLDIMVTNTMANRYMLNKKEYLHGEKWGKVLKSGLTEKVEIKIYDKKNSK